MKIWAFARLLNLAEFLRKFSENSREIWLNFYEKCENLAEIPRKFSENLRENSTENFIKKAPAPEIKHRLDFFGRGFGGGVPCEARKFDAVAVLEFLHKISTEISSFIIFPCSKRTSCVRTPPPNPLPKKSSLCLISGAGAFSRSNFSHKILRQISLNFTPNSTIKKGSK